MKSNERYKYGRPSLFICVRVASVDCWARSVSPHSQLLRDPDMLIGLELVPVSGLRGGIWNRPIAYCVGPPRIEVPASHGPGRVEAACAGHPCRECRVIINLNCQQ